MSSPRLVKVLVLGLTTILGAGCGVVGQTPSVRPNLITLRTQADPGATAVCTPAGGGGTLVVDPVSGLGVADSAGNVSHVYWPFGYTARPDPERIALLDRQGRIVAHVGDVIAMTGGFDNNTDWWACQYEAITLLATQSP